MELVSTTLYKVILFSSVVPNLGVGSDKSFRFLMGEERGEKSVLIRKYVFVFFYFFVRSLEGNITI